LLQTKSIPNSLMSYSPNQQLKPIAKELRAVSA